MRFVLPPPAPASVAVEGTEARFAVRRIFCVGRNYAEHAREFGNDPDRDPPFFFTKPADAVVDSGTRVPYPPATAELHYEAELVVALGPGGSVWGCAAGNDLTRRDLQAEAKAMRRPWDMAKAFDASAVVGPLRPGPLPQGRICGVLNGTPRQQAQLSDMIWSVPEIIAHLSRLVTLAPGDLLFTGTPAGVGALVRGDRFTVEIDGLAPAVVTIG
ncbi:fumarylacetoacetate hydrolase family protein [Rhodobacter sp. Har01]|uniref:fumarylacetoacetate hydrolase family protein n=1 Tax=Rhodobacter sp. Har01 TaxID=2883999 RepID=UPI001D076AC1|nr:fumarylacetoacetate hydrolase family protein [Rhodobacter sp. Har01]MCB6179576.1 fumarylacetoacetate hydrolase family protein [Rhodobacter sp. Har01]